MTKRPTIVQRSFTDGRPVVVSAPPDLSSCDRPEGAAAVRVDAHVHIYPQFPLGSFLTRAYKNLALGGGPGAFEGLLLLSETSDDDAFGMLAAAARGDGRLEGGDGWSVHRIAREEMSLRLQGPDGLLLFIVAGRQIVTAEDLEVLALGTTRRFDDGEPISRVLERLTASEVLAVVPWGFGKWMGERGKILDRLIERSRPDQFELGDNRGRPRFWGRPKHFSAGAKRGFRVLPGSDPLPVAGGEMNVGAYGFEIDAPFAPERPWQSLLDALGAGDAPLRTFGRRERALPFMRDQIAMQLVKRRRQAERGGS